MRKRDYDQQLGITCSIGVATHDGGAFDSVASLVKSVDDGLYAAKHAGRNCVRAHSPAQTRTPETVPAQ